MCSKVHSVRAVKEHFEERKQSQTTANMVNRFVNHSMYIHIHTYTHLGLIQLGVNFLMNFNSFVNMTQSMYSDAVVALW
jgi:hypothetical protein